MVLHIGGRAAMPRLSENDVFYWPQELKKFDGVKVPLRYLHAKDGGFDVGEAQFRYDEDDRQVWYKAVIKNKLVEEEIRKSPKEWKVSIGTLPKTEGKDDKICHRDGTCVSAPVFEGPRELALVKNPGMPEVTMEIFGESKELTMHCESTHITSDSTPLNTNDNNMSETDSTKTECNCDKSAEVKAEEDPCPEGWVLKDGKCVKAEPATAPETKAEEAPVADSTKQVDINVNVTKDEAAPKTESIDVDKLKTEMKAAILEEMGDKFTPKSDVKTADAKPSTDNDWRAAEAEYTPEYIKKGLKTGKVSMTINKEDWIKEHSQNLVTEAVSTSGTVPGIKTTTDIIIIPGSNTFEPIRSLGQFEALPTGVNTAKFWTLDVAAFGTAAGVIDGKIGTVGSHTLTAIDVTTSPRGVLQQVTKDQLRDFPPKFMEKLKEVMRLAAIKDEHNLIVQTIADTNSDFNNGTSVLTAGWPAHISGTDGTFINNGTAEDATGEMQKEGITTSRRYLAQRGHNPVTNRLVAIISSRAYDNLVNDSDISRFIQEGNPSISEQGLMSRYFGVEIMVSEELLVQNNSQRNVVLVAGKAFALASQKEMEIQMEEQIEGQYVNIIAVHDIGVEELDKSAYTIVSTKND